MSNHAINYHVLNYGVSNVGVLAGRGFRVMSLNINRLYNKISDLEYFLAVINIDFDALILCET